MSEQRGAYYKHGRAWTPLYRAREAAGLTQDEAGHALGVSGRTFRTWEQQPQREVTAAIASAFAAIAPNPERLRREFPSAFGKVLAQTGT